MGNSLQRRRRRGRADDDSDDRGEGCSYTQIGNPSGLQESSTERDTLSDKAECTCTQTQPTHTRRTRPHTLAWLAATTAILTTSTTLASASPVHKGKGSAAEDMSPLSSIQHNQDTRLNAQSRASYPLGRSASRPRRLGALALPALKDRQQQPHLDKREGDTYHSNTPEGIASHYEYVDGQWVPSSDWSLNGQNGAASDGSEGRASSYDENDGSALEAGGREEDGSAGQGPSTRQNNASSSPTTTTVSSTTLGWAKSTNAILGVDIETELSDHSTSTHSTTSGKIVTRSSMATYSTGTPSSTSSATSPSNTQHSTAGVGAYDFSRDVPSGWISDGRTAAYAVPVIIGLSVFLACIIFGSILVLLRLNKSRKRRRKAVSNGQLKLSEEGNVKTRPSSPAVGSDDDDGVQAAGFSSSIDNGGRRRSADDENNEENEKNIKRRIGRKWTPNLSNNSILRKRRKKIAQLFRRDEPVQEVIIEDVSSDEGARVNEEINEREDFRRRSLSSYSSSSRRAETGLHTDDTLSRTTSNISTVTSANVVREDYEQDRTYDRPPSLRVDTSSTSATGNDQASSPLAGTSLTSPANASREALQLPHARNESIDQGDHHAVPVPSIGPPAYMQPSTPAYSRAPAVGGSSSSTATVGGGLAVPASGYLSNVSTPGLSDEKRALLGFPNLSGEMVPGSSNDAFREQRRYEHLYSSREGGDDQLEQMAGAPTLSLPLSLPFSSHPTSSTTGSSQSVRHIRGVVNENEDEELARRVQQDAIEEHRRELQASFAGHVAVSDKEVLGRLRMAASAPSIPPSNEGQGSTSPLLPSAGANDRMRLNFQEASAPSFDETEEDEANVISSEGDIRSTSSTNSSLLPAPPQPFEHALHQLPHVDEKTRLRQTEERQALSPFLSLSGVDDSNASSAPSAPPLSTDADHGFTSAPSAPVLSLEEEYHQYPSAPPAVELDDTAPSAPSYVVDEEDDASSTSDPESRPCVEGVV